MIFFQKKNMFFFNFFPQLPNASPPNASQLRLLLLDPRASHPLVPSAPQTPLNCASCYSTHSPQSLTRPTTTRGCTPFRTFHTTTLGCGMVGAGAWCWRTGWGVVERSKETSICGTCSKVLKRETSFYGMGSKKVKRERLAPSSQGAVYGQKGL